MRNVENQTNPAIMIMASGKQYQVQLEQMSEFLTQCAGIGIHELTELDWELDLINERMIDGASNDEAISELKRGLKLLRHLRLMFKGVLWEVPHA